MTMRSNDSQLRSFVSDTNPDRVMGRIGHRTLDALVSSGK
jgi:hypothetical protein